MLLNKGIRRLGLIGGNESHIVTRSRYEGFADAFRMAGRPVERELIYLGEEQQPGIAQAVKELLEKKTECIVCMDDMICNHVLKDLEESGIKVPEQVKIASFYAGITTENTAHPVMTLEFNAKKLGYVTCNTLIDLIEGKETAARQLLPYAVKEA